MTFDTYGSSGGSGHQITMTIDTNTFTSLSVPEVTWNNNNSWCGETDWVLNTAQSIAGKTCEGDDFWNTNTTIYGVYLLDGNKLFLNYSSASYPSGVDAGDNDTLTKQSTSTSDNSSSSGSGIFVAVGFSGNIVRSTDNGSSWDNATSPTGNAINGVTFGNNTFVGVGYDGNIVRSTDNGSSWDNATNSNANHLNEVTFGNNTFVAVGGSGNIVRSTDNGSSWDNATSPTGNAINAVGFGNNTFVAVGSDGNIVRSTDNGSSWDNATSPTANHLNGVTYLSKNCTVAGETLNYSLGKCSGTLTLTSIEDSYVSDGQVNTNFGSSSSLLIDADPTSYEIFIKSPEIDQIPSGATVSSATLVLTSFNSGSTAEARQVVTAWDENSITWNNRPTDDAGQFTTFNTSSGTVNINVKAAVEAWISGASNHGLRLRSSGGDGSDFRSSEYTTANQRPSFVIDLSY
jgi:hypothetical protein